MTDFIVRSFRKSDRDQVTRLVNAHCAAVLPGCTVPVNSVLNQFEREPGEFIVDPWVAERVPLVAEQRGAIVAAALLLRYRSDPDVGESMRGAGEVRWLLFWPLAPPDNSNWDDGGDAADALADNCFEQLRSWGCTRQFAAGSLPAPGIYGVPEQWPHVASLFLRAGLRPQRLETVLCANLRDIPDLGELGATAGTDKLRLTVRRSVGINGTRCSAVLEGQVCGYIEVERLDRPERAVGAAFADIGNLWIREDKRRQGVATDLLQYGARWLRRGGAQQLLAYAEPDEAALIAFFRRSGFEVATTTQTGWTKPLESHR